MKPTGVNMTNVKQINRASVLQQLLRQGAMSRTDLAASLRLTTATLTSICSDFLQRGLLVESSKSKTQTPGRQKCPLDINTEYRYVLAISLHYNGHVLAVTDLRGKAVATAEFALPKPYTAPAFLKELANACVRLMWDNRIPSEKVLAAGVGIVGSVNQEEGISLHPFNIFEEAQVPIRALLQAEFSFPVCVENNMCAYLNAEYLLGNAGDDNILALKWGPGVGSASSINGQVCKNHLYHSAEVGHTYCYPTLDVTCKCGRKGCLEQGVHVERLLEKIRALLPDEPALQAVCEAQGEPAPGHLAAYLGADCPALHAFAANCVRDLAEGVNNAIQVFSPDRVFLLGMMFDLPGVSDHFLREIAAINPLLAPHLFCASSLDWRQEYLGPAATAIQRYFVEPGGEGAPAAAH